MSEAKWHVVEGDFPSMIEIKGASFNVPVVISASDITLEQSFARLADAHKMAAANELYEALKACAKELHYMINKHNTHSNYDNSWGYDHQIVYEAQLALSKARGE